MADQLVVLERGGFVKYVCFSDGKFRSYGKFIGTREALLARGFITETTELPKRPCGCVHQRRPEPGEGKISMLGDGRLRVTLDGPISARRDREFRAFMASALVAPKKPQQKRPPSSVSP